MLSHLNNPEHARTAAGASDRQGKLAAWLNAVVLAVPLALLAPPECRGQGAPASFSLEPQEGVLLLRSGRTLQGRYTRDGDRYYLALPSGEIRIRASDVEAALPSLDDCYRYRRQRVDAGNVTSHLDLAQWSIEHGLLGAAAEQLTIALMLDSNHPRVALLERRLQAARTQSKPAAATTDATLEEVIPAEDLERFCKSLPDSTVEIFTHTIQPLLQNTCGNAACHGPRSPTAFRMLRAPANQAPSSRLTQRNLYAVLQMVNRETPTKSPLLTVPIRPHGPVSKAIFQPHDAVQYRELVRWVMIACGDPQKPRPATVGLKPPALMSPPIGATPIQNSNARLDQQVQRAAASEPVGNVQPPSPPKAERAVDPTQANSPSPQPQSAKTVSPRASDPFHPVLFNRRFFPDGKPDQQPATKDEEPLSQPPDG